MKIFLRLKALYNFMELAEMPPQKRRNEDKRNKTYVHRKLGKTKTMILFNTDFFLMSEENCVSINILSFCKWYCRS